MPLGTVAKREGVAARVRGQEEEMSTKRRVGFVGKSNVPVNVALEGLLHLESTPYSFLTLCNRHLSFALQPDKILNDFHNYGLTELNICKRCTKLEKEDA